MSPFEHLSSTFPNIEAKALDRLISDGSLYDGKSHALRDGISKEEARGILAIAAKTARDCGWKLILSSDEAQLMSSKVIPL
jgi:hypothetical protein